jgi:transposase
MARNAAAVTLTDEERATLSGWIRAGTTEQRLVLRAQIILAAADDQQTQAIAARLGQRPATVSKWRGRFAAQGLAGLQDEPRTGRPRRYAEADELRLLALLDQEPPARYGHWNGRLLARALGNVSVHYVWQVLRRYGISLRQRHSWCVSTDPEFAAKAADITALYLNPPEQALVICVDEKPHIQALERTQGYLRLPNGRAITGFAHEYQRHGTTTLFAALQVATGMVRTGHYRRRRRREFLDFMNELVRDHDPHTQLHVVLDNLNTHKPKHDRWLARHPHVHFHYTPTHASWLNQIEIWFSILARQALRGRSFRSARELRQGIDDFVQAYNAEAAPFEWKKAVVHQGPLAHSYAELRN